MSCTCGSDRIVKFYAKHDDRANLVMLHLKRERIGYTPVIGPFGGDDVRMNICLQCGLIQDWEPISDEEIVDDDVDTTIDDEGAKW